MKIVHISTNYNSQAGITRRTNLICTALAERGFEVVLICGEENDVFDGTHPFSSIHTVSSLGKSISVFKDLRCIIRLVSILRSEKPNLVHTHMAKAGILGRLAAFICGTKAIVHTVHGPTFPDFFPPIKRLCYWVAEYLVGLVTDYFVFVGNENRNEFIEAKIATYENSYVIRSGRPRGFEICRAFDLNSVSTINHSDRLKVGLIGRLVPQKGHIYAIECLKFLVDHLEHPPVLVIAGSPIGFSEDNYVEKINRLISHYDLSDHIIWTGYVNEIGSIYASIDLTIMPSEYEGLANVCIESLICGVPVIAFDVGGVSEVISHDVNGFIVPRLNQSELNKTLLALCKNPCLMNKLKNFDSSTIRAIYSAEFMIQEKVKFYEQIINRGNLS